MKNATAKATANRRRPRAVRRAPLLASFAGWLERVAARLFAGLGRRERPRQLRLAETVSLGDKRFVALVEVGPERFLIGGTAQALTVLGQLRPEPAPFADWLGATQGSDRVV